MVYVRCPGHTIHSSYSDYVAKVPELTGLSVESFVKEVLYENWNPYQLQAVKKS